jgi:hypothetical protein
MNQRSTTTRAALIALSAALGLSATIWAQDKPASAGQLYREIAGVYQFERGDGKSLTLEFYEKDGRLFAAPPGEGPEEAVPVKGSPLKFELVVTDGGKLFRFEFMRNEKQVIDRCIMKVRDMELAGTRQKRGPLPVAFMSAS